MALPFILPASSPFKAYHGSAFLQPLRYAEKDGSDIVAKDITGYKFRSHIRDSYLSDTILINMHSDTGEFVITDAGDGSFDMKLTLAQVKSLEVPLKTAKVTDVPYKDFVLDVEAIPPPGEDDSFQFLKGVLRVYGEVTREEEED